MPFLRRLTSALLLASIPVLAQAGPPSFSTATCAVTLDGVRLGSALTPGGASLRNTFAYEPATHRYHFWGFAADDANWPSAASSLRGVVHAVAQDGVHFISDSNLSYAFGSADYHAYGSTIDPPLDFLRAVFDTDSGSWKLFAWTENVGSPVGSYNYNSSVSDLGTLAGTTSVQHQGPLSGSVAGNHVGTFGLVDGQLYLRVDSATGGNGRFDYTDGMPASYGAMLNEADLYAGTPYCWGLDPACGTTDPRIRAYVHNVGRTLKQPDGTLATYYAFRDWNTAARLDKQIWTVESTDGGATWSAPAGTFSDAGAITLDGVPLAADGNFSSPDVVVAPGVCRGYFSTKDADGKYVVAGATTGSACDALFVDGFEMRCGE